MLHRKKSQPRGWGDSQRTGEQAYPLFVLAEMLMKKLSGIVGKIYEQETCDCDVRTEALIERRRSRDRCQRALHPNGTEWL